MLLGCIVVYSIGVMSLPHLWMKFYIARDENTIKVSALGTALYLSSYYIPAAMVGLAAAVANVTGIPGVLDKGFIGALTAKYGSADAVMATMITYLLHPAAAGFLLAGAAAAAMSTLDNFLLSIALLLTRDVYQPFVRPNRPEREYILISRIIALIWALIGCYFALLKPGLIFDIVAIAASGGVLLLPLILQMVIPKRKLINGKGAIAGFIVGAILVMLFATHTGKYFRMPITYHPAVAGLIGLLGCTVVSLIVSVITKPSQRELETFKQYREILYGA
jgi:Na+/proline symporter